MKFCSFLFHIYNYAIDTLFKIWSSTLYRKKAVNALSQLNRFHKMTSSDIFCGKNATKNEATNPAHTSAPNVIGQELCLGITHRL